MDESIESALSETPEEGEASYLMIQEKFEDAIELLGASRTTPIQLAILGECYFMTKNWFKMFFCIDKLRATLPEYFPGAFSTRLLQEVELYMHQDNYTKAAMFLPAVAKHFYVHESDPRKVAYGIKKCVFRCCDVVKIIGMKTNHVYKLATKVTVEYMPEMVGLLSSLKPLIPIYAEDCEMWCFGYIGQAHKSIHNGVRRDEFYRKSLTLMESQCNRGVASLSKFRNLLKYMELDVYVKQTGLQGQTTYEIYDWKLDTGKL